MISAETHHFASSTQPTDLSWDQRSAPDRNRSLFLPIPRVTLPSYNTSSIRCPDGESTIITLPLDPLYILPQETHSTQKRQEEREECSIWTVLHVSLSFSHYVFCFVSGNSNVWMSLSLFMWLPDSESSTPLTQLESTVLFSYPQTCVTQDHLTDSLLVYIPFSALTFFI